MKTLKLKPTDKFIQAYYHDISQLQQLHFQHEGAVAPAFARLLHHCAKQVGLTLSEQYIMRLHGRNLRFDAAFVDEYNLIHGVWEAKDSQDNLDDEVKKKFKAGYPKFNIMFQSPRQLIIWQNGQEVFNSAIAQPAELVRALKLFFEYQPPDIEQWQDAVAEFQGEIPKLAQGLLERIHQEYRTNRRFREAFDGFGDLCRKALNPNLATAAIEEMLIQHLLTERIFRKVFDHPEFINRNVIASEIEQVITALTSPYFKRDDFLKRLDPFYLAIERNAAHIESFNEKQTFLNTVYERFFQGYSVKTADTHGIVYTPQPIVDFMVNSVDYLLEREFGRTLSSSGVEILDPFVGTGNFIVRLLRQIKRSQLPYKYAHEIGCNEVMLLPYYIASLNIEHEYYSLTETYQPFTGICFVDTFQLAEPLVLPIFSKENTARISAQRESPIFVVMGNPPYNAHQVNENDHNRNRKYPKLDKDIANSYAKASRASNKNQLSDPYVKAFRWASDRIGEEGVVAFVTNNSFIDGIAFDGMRKHLAQDFDVIYVLDLSGNVRKNPKLSGTTHNVFGIQVGVSVTFLIRRNSQQKPRQAQIYYARVDEWWRKKQKYDFLNQAVNIGGINWQVINPNSHYTWLTAGLSAEFETLLPMGDKTNKGLATVGAIFQNYSQGAGTARDAWVHNFDSAVLAQNVQRLIEIYNYELYRWHNRHDQTISLDDFVTNDDKKIKWSSRLKECLLSQQKAEFSTDKIRHSFYRPFCQQYLFFDSILNHRQSQLPKIFPTPATASENLAICVNSVGNNKPFHCLMVNQIPDLHLTGDSQCFPFYTYAEDGTQRQENITDWALRQYQRHYADPTITKWDIFYSIYAILHQPSYREKYAANLRRDLPHIPFVKDFRRYAELGRRLMELHVHYDNQPEYPLEWLENPAVPLNWREEQMKLSQGKGELVYNDFLTLRGIPAEAFQYRLGNRSALEWVIDQYQVHTDKRSGLTNDPNDLNDERAILRLVGQVITVSVETVKIIEMLTE